jgi:hypothetical protein
MLLADRRKLVTLPSAVYNRGHLADGQLPDCPIEPFEGAWGDVDLLHATNKFGNPVSHGGGGKVIVILRNKQTDPLDEQGGLTTTSVRWTVTFRRI